MILNRKIIFEESFCKEICTHKNVIGLNINICHHMDICQTYKKACAHIMKMSYDNNEKTT